MAVMNPINQFDNIFSVATDIGGLANAGSTASWNASGSSMAPNFTDHPIKGDMIMVSTTIADLGTPYDSDHTSIKQTLANRIAEELLKQNKIAFTKTFAPDSRITYRAYLYVVPDTDTHLLRVRNP
jgi:hypothetical protein